MSRRWFVLRILLLIFSAVVNAARNTKDCSAPEIPHGFFVSERSTFSHDTELYYGCDQGFMPVEGSWWGTVTCQYGNWSSSPQCIDNNACFDPEIPNANYDSFKYVEHNVGIRIKCNPGYEDKRARARAVCQHGTWTGLPNCQKTDDQWCEPPPQVQNAVIINQDPKEIYAEGVSVQYMCRSGFQLESHSNTATCNYGKWLSPPSCRRIPTDRVPVSPSGSGSDDGRPMFSKIDRCGSPPSVENGVAFIDSARRFVAYKCAYLHNLRGNRLVRCLNGQWTPAPTCEVNYCKLETSRFKALENIGNIFMESSTQRQLSCSDSSWWKKTSAFARCEDNRLTLTECCTWMTHKLENCDQWEIISSH